MLRARLILRLKVYVKAKVKGKVNIEVKKYG